MLHYEYTTNASIVLWLTVAIASFIFQCVGCYLLITQKDKKVMHYLLLHLGGTELAIVVWDGFHTTRYIILKMDLSKLIKLHQTGLIILLLAQMISIILITLDRTLAVKLTIKYRVVVTKQRLLAILVFSWVLCSSHGVVVYHSSHQVLNKILSAWEIFVAVVIFIGYTYIVVIVQCRSRNLSEDNQQIRRPKLKLTIPGLIVTTFIVLCLIPDLLLAIGIKFSLWILSSFYFNFITDSLIYIFGTGRIRSRVMLLFHRSSSETPNSSVYVVTTV